MFRIQKRAAGRRPKAATTFSWMVAACMVHVSLQAAVTPHLGFAPVEDGNPATSEFGYANSSAINAVSFICSALTTVSNKQIIAYYGRHQTNTVYEFNNTIWIGRRDVGAHTWEVFRTQFQANNINDGHDVVCFGIDGDGVLHMSWGMHGDAFHYARTTTNVISDLPIEFGPDTTMTGHEHTATYPQFLTLPDGDLVYIYRKGTSGAGDTYINRYTRSTQTWTNVHVAGSAPVPFIKGTGWNPDYNAYGQMPCVDAEGSLFLVWTWRYQSDSPTGQSGYQTNHDFDYGKSTNGGLTWLRFNGTPYTLPISQFGENGDPNTTADRILSIPEGSSLINQAGMCLDQSGLPVIATWWAPGTATNNFRRQYMIAFAGTNGWEVRQVSNRTRDPVGIKYSESNVRDLGRPVVVSDAQDRILVLYRDNQDNNGLTLVHGLPREVDPERRVWTAIDLTTDNLGNYEPVIDLGRWQRDNVLHVLYQPSRGLGYTPPSNNASPIGVLEWNAAAYFAHRPELDARLNAGTNIMLSFKTQKGWGYRVQSSVDLLDWDTVSTLEGEGTVLQHSEPVAANTMRFWRVTAQEGGYGQ